MTTPPTYQVGQPNPVGWSYKCTYNFSIGLLRWQGLFVPLSSPSSVVGRERRTSRYLLAASLLYCDFLPGIHLNGCPLSISLSHVLSAFLISLSGGKFPCASLRLPPFHDLHILLTLQPYHTAGRYIAGEARSEKRPTTAPALPAAAPHLVSRGCDLLRYTPSRSQPLHTSFSWPFRVSIDN
jgi:hypothetical protein